VTTKIPHDINAEESVVGAMLLDYDSALTAIDLINAEDFYSVRLNRAFTACKSLVREGIVPDPITVAERMGDPKLVSELTNLMLGTPGTTNLQAWAAIVSKNSTSRRLMHQLSTSVESIAEGSDPFSEASSIEKFISSIGSMRKDEPEALTIEQLEANAESVAPVVIPGMMHQDYRTIIVAEEGSGKSLLLRTIAMSASQGIHPFSHQPMRPVRALIIDLENPAQAILQTAVPFSNTLASRSDCYDPERLKIFRRPGGIDIRKISDRADVQREIAAHRPELVCIGPIYKMYRRAGNESYEDSADEAMAVLDDLRTKYGFALVMEHHAAKGKQGEKRDLSPMGSQRWMAWPEVGISLYKDIYDPTIMNVRRYRGDRLTGVNWPDRIVRDKTWLVDGIWDGPVGI
jgi:hypothetical protein